MLDRLCWKWAGGHIESGPEAIESWPEAIESGPEAIESGPKAIGRLERVKDIL